MNRLKQVQEFLTEVEEYLKKTLQDENLSTAAQIRRRHLLDRFYALDLHASDGRNPLGSTASHYKSAGNALTTKSAEHLRKEDVSESSVEIEECAYNLYEEPIMCLSASDSTPAPSHALAEDCSDTEYESFDEGDSIAPPSKDQKPVNPTYHDSRASRDVPLPQVRKNSSNEVDLLSRLPNVLYSGHLYQKGLLSWLKRFCIISDSRLLTFRSRKHLRPLLVLDLIGCDVESSSRENSKYRHALKISRPTPGEGQLGMSTLANSAHSSMNANNEINNCWFFARDRETVDAWIHHLCLGGSLRSSNGSSVQSPPEVVPADVEIPAAPTCDNQASISGGSSEGGSGDGMAAGTIALERKLSLNSASGVGLTLKRKLKLGESLQSLILSPFSKGRKDDKDDKIKKAFVEAGGLESELSHVAGYVNVNSDLSEGQGRWLKKFCVARQGRLDCYKDPLDENIEFSVPLKNSLIVDADKQLKKICIMCEAVPGERVEVNLETFNPTDFNKWLVFIFKETDGCRDPIGESIYNEVYDWKVSSMMTNDIQPPPLPKQRPQSKFVCSSSPSENDAQLYGNIGSSNNNNNNNLGNNNNSSLEQSSGKSLFVIAEDNLFAGDFINKDDSFHLEEIMASAFDNIKKTLNGTKKGSPLLSSKSPSATSLASSTSAVSSPLRDSARNRCHYELMSKYPSVFSSAAASLSSSSSSSSLSLLRTTPLMTSSPLKSKEGSSANRACPGVYETQNTLRLAKSNLRSSSVPRNVGDLGMSSKDALKIEDVSEEDGGGNKLDGVSCSKADAATSLVDSKSTNRVATNSSAPARNSFVHSNLNFANIKNELNKRHSVFNYCLSGGNSNNINSLSINKSHASRNNNIYSKPEKVAGSFITTSDPATSKSQPLKTVTSTSKVTSPIATSKVTLPSIAILSKVISPTETTHGTMPSSLTSSASSLQSSTASLISKALSAKMLSTAATTSAAAATTTSTASLSLISSSAVKSTASASVAVRRANPTDPRGPGSSNKPGPDKSTSDLVGKRASVIGLSTLSSSNSKLREARAEIRKSSLELMSMLPATLNKQLGDKGSTSNPTLPPSAIAQSTAKMPCSTSKQN